MNTAKWKLFKYSDVFLIKKGKRLTIADQINGKIPYISSSSENNGIDNFIGNGYTDVNCISIACYGSIGEVFYHKDKVWISDNANVIYLKNHELNVYLAMFLLSILYREKYRYSYGFTGKKDRLGLQSIKLPIDDNELPNWTYMENYIQNVIIPKLPQKTKAIWINQFNKTPLNTTNKLKLTDRNWRFFQIEDLFELEKGGGTNINELYKGKYPFISATALNNGVTAYVSNSIIYKGNVITVTCNGSIGEAFYQRGEFCASSDVNILTLNHTLNEYIAVFLCTIISKEKYRFNYGRKWGKEKMKISKIKLPVDNNGKPDWQFMEDYIKGLPYSRNI